MNLISISFLYKLAFWLLVALAVYLIARRPSRAGRSRWSQAVERHGWPVAAIVVTVGLSALFGVVIWRLWPVVAR